MSNDFNLAAFESAETAVLQVKAVDGKPLMHNGKPVEIEMYGPGSEQAAAAQSEFDTAVRNAALQAMKVEGQKVDTAPLIAKKLAGVTKAVINFPIPGGAVALYSNKKLGYITAQADRYHSDWANFPPACTTS